MSNITLDWVLIPEGVRSILKNLIKDSVKQAAVQTNLEDVKALEQANINAIEYAEKRAAELVGMRWADGELVENPNAIWRIDQPTRKFLRNSVTQALKDGWSSRQLQDAILNNYAFSEDRANNIARTEITRAEIQGNLVTYKEAENIGIELLKKWITAQDDKVSPDCVANGRQDAIPLDKAFISGVKEPPEHPRCRCDIIPAIVE